MSIIVYYLAPPDPAAFFQNMCEPRAETFGSSELGPALKRVEELRKSGAKHVVISSELEDSIGKAGVDSIENGKTPDGHPYTWMKRRNS